MTDEMNKELQAAVRRLVAGDALPKTAVLVDALAELGLDWVKEGNELRLAKPRELLDADVIAAALSPAAQEKLSRLEIFWQIGSTNTYLLERATEPDFDGRVCTAEQQLAGKGRRGRHWVSPFGRNIYLSLGQRIPRASGIAGLSLVVGMTLVTVLREMGIDSAGLKWPNDVLADNGKLAGILVEVEQANRDAYLVVIGMGINLSLDGIDVSSIEQSFSTLDRFAQVSRNALLGKLLDALVQELARFRETGFSAYASRWPEFDVYAGAEVAVKMAEQEIPGINRGIDDQGNLLVETEDGVRAFNAGEVSLRPARSST